MHALTATTARRSQLPPSLDDDRVLAAPKAAEMLDVSVSALRRNAASGRLPAPVQITARRLGWRVRDLRNFLAAQSA